MRSNRAISAACWLAAWLAGCTYDATVLQSLDDAGSAGTAGTVADGSGAAGGAGGSGSGASGGDAGASGATDAAPDVPDAADADAADADASAGGTGGDAGTDANDASTDGSSDADADANDAAPDAPPDVASECPVGSVPVPTGCRPVSLATRVGSGIVRCRVRTDGTLWCWGQPDTQWTPSWQEAVHETQVGAESDWTSVSVGTHGICGTRAPGTLWCLGQLYVPNTTGAGNHVENHDTPVQIGADADWLQVAAGQTGFCGIKQGGTLWCWGSIRPLDPGSSPVTATPVQVGTDTSWSMVATNSNQVCALRTTGALECFGTNAQGQLGDGTTTPRAEPAPIADPGPWLSVALGSASCAVRWDGTLWCWGLGLGSSPVQVDPASDWIAVTSNIAQSLTCGLRAGGRLMCNDATSSAWTFTQIDAALGYTTVAPGCAEHQDGTVRCWGRPALGDGSRSVEAVPVRVGSASDWTSVTLSGISELGLHAGGVVESRLPGSPAAGPWLELTLADYSPGCAVRSDHTLWCWNLADDGDFTWVQQGVDADWLHVTAGSVTTEWACGIREGTTPGQGALWCSAQKLDPAWRQVGSANDWVSLSRSHGPCGIHADGSLTCWNVTTAGASWDLVFTDVGTDHDWSSVSAPTFASCAIKTDESLWCWGNSTLSNQWGQLGDGTRTPSLVPKHVAPGTHWAEVASGNYSTCGIQTDGSLWCWGVNTSGQLGLGAPGTQRLVPTRVGAASDWQRVALSGWGGINAFTCGIRSGELWCWGSNAGFGGVSWSSPSVTTPRLVVDPPPPGGGAFCPWPSDSDLDGYAGCLGDCDDANPDVNPAAPETCNGADDDCDGVTDEGC